ncbi:hypothetical protein Tco_0307302 [Tanacetum coccineum]
MGDRESYPSLGDYSRPKPQGYRITIELPEGNNVVPLRSDTIRLVQNGCSFLRNLSTPRIQISLHLFQFSYCGTSSNWLECLAAGSISTGESYYRFLAQFFSTG